MYRRLLTSALVVSLCYACGSSDGAGGGSSGAAGASGAANPGAGAGGGATTAGAAGMVVAGGGTSGGASMAGAGGAAPAAGAAGMPAMAGAGGMVATDTGQSVTQRGGDSARTAHWIQSSFTTANVAKMAMDTAFVAKFTGQMSAVPLFVPGATPGTGFFIVATAGNMIYSLSETTGAVNWMKSLGAPQGGKHDFTNAGEVSTPVIDLATRTVYLCAGMASGHYELHALNIDTGNPVAGWPASLANVKSGNTTMDFGVTNQRSALSLVNGTVYIAFGGYFGDGGDYHGWVVGVSTADPTKITAWATMDAQQAGIWAAGGMASDGTGVFAITGNANAGNDHTNSDSEEIIRVTNGVAARDNNNMFFPDIWQSGMNNGDKDFGSCSPAVINVPGSTPAKLIVAPAKPGHVYVLDAAHLGGSNGALSDTKIAATDQESVYSAPTAFQVGTGTSVALATAGGSKCIGGDTNGAVMGLTVQLGTATVKPALIIKWCAAIDQNDDTRRRSPVSTNSNAAGADPIVWFMNASKLMGINGDTGAVVFAGGTGTCDGVRRFTAPVVANGRVIVGADGHLCSWSVH